MTRHAEFERMSREQRLTALKFVADRDGIDSHLYRSLAAHHQYLLERANGWHRPINK
jgi:hypothetical protein